MEVIMNKFLEGFSDTIFYGIVVCGCVTVLTLVVVGWHLKELSQLHTRVAEADEVIAQMAADNVKMSNQMDELQTRLSTLLKASEGMEKALEEIVGLNSRSWNQRVLGKEVVDNGYAEIAKQALADFRAVKETLEKGAGK
jgi:hypothetical protein